MENPTQDGAQPLLERLEAADARALAWVSSRRRGWLVRAMRSITRTGDATTVVTALATALVLRGGRGVALVTVSTIAALALFRPVKRLCRRARPTCGAALETPKCFSMPSGHATCAWALAVSLSAVAPAVAPFAIAWAGAVAASRVVLGVHYPFDVIAGAALGTFSALVTLAIFG